MQDFVEYCGLPVVTGLVVAPIVVIDESAPIPSPEYIRGKVAIVRIASPSVVLWLRNAAGLVVEKGGVASHGAILAREFNIPAIVGVAGIYDFSLDGKLCKLQSGEGVLRVWI